MSTTTGRAPANSSRASSASRTSSASSASIYHSDIQREIAWAPLALFLSLLAAILLFVVINSQSGAPTNGVDQSDPLLATPSASWSPSGN